MKRKRNIIILAIVLLGVLILTCFMIRNRSMAKKNGELFSNRMIKVSEEMILDEVVPFEWDKAYSFFPYEDINTIEATIGFSDSLLRESLDDDYVNLVFVKDKKIVAFVYGGVNDIGYRINFDNPTVYGTGKRYRTEIKDGILHFTEKNG